MVHSLATPTDCMCGFLWTPNLLSKVGYLDENFFPGYFEDNDYRHRIIQSDASVATIPLRAYHDRSSTLKSSSEFQKKNQYTFSKNYKYYVEKWGGAPTQEKYAALSRRLSALILGIRSRQKTKALVDLKF